MRLSGDRDVSSVRATLANVDEPELGVDIAELVSSSPRSPDRLSDGATFLLEVYGR